MIDVIQGVLLGVIVGMAALGLGWFIGSCWDEEEE